MRLMIDGNRRQDAPGCPVLYDEVITVPVIAAGDTPPAHGIQRVPLVADWLAEVFEDDSCSTDNVP